MSHRVAFLAAALHERTNAYEADAKYFLHALAAEQQSGFSPETMAMLRLSADMATLRSLADRIETVGNELVREKVDAS
jgi:hypothetical protein